jgi:hypothetical protein
MRNSWCFLSLALVAACDPNVPSRQAPPSTAAANELTCTAEPLGVEISACNAQPLGQFAAGYSADSNDIYGQLNFETGLNKNDPLIQGRNADTLLKALKRVFGVEEVKTVIVTVKPKLDGTDLPASIVALLQYSSAGGTPQWTSQLDRHQETPWYMMNTDATFSYSIEYGVSSQTAADVAKTWDTISGVVPAFSPEVVAAKATISTIAASSQKLVTAILNATGAKIKSAFSDSIKPLAGPNKSIEYAFGPDESPTIRIRAYVRYRTSMLKGGVDDVSKLTSPQIAFDEVERIQLLDGTSAVKKGRDAKGTAILAASRKSNRDREVVQEACSTIRSYFESEAGLNKVDAAFATARILIDQPILADTIASDLREPCITEIANAVQRAGATFPPYQASTRALVNQDSTSSFFKKVISMSGGELAPEKFGSNMELASTTRVVDLINNTQDVAVDSLSLMQKLGSLGITEFGCYSTARVASTGSDRDLSGRVALARGAQANQRYALEFWGEPSPDNNKVVSVNYVVIRKAQDADFDSANANCTKFK